MLRLKALRMIALLLALTLFAAACGDDGEDTADESEEDVTDEGDEDEQEEEEPADEGDGEEEDDADSGAGDDQLELGYVLPETGDLAFLGDPMISSVEFAVERMNEAGGVLDQDVTLSGSDEAGDAAIASESADGLLAEGVDAIVGAAATGMTMQIIDQVTGAGVVQCSPSNTGPLLTDYDDGGFYFRTAPTDALQGPVLAEQMVADGHSTVALIARGDDYGEGLLDATSEAFQASGGTVAEEIIYDPDTSTFDSEVEAIAAADPDAVAMVSFEEGVQLIQGLIEAGYGPSDIGLYGTDGIRNEELNESVDPGDPNVIDGMKGTAPDPGVDESFLEDLQEFDPELEVLQFAPQAYDCANLVALAAVSAGSADSESIQGEMIGVTQGDTECTQFDECLEALDAGDTIAYTGAAGPYEFTDAGEPSRGTYEVWEWADGELTSIDRVESTIE